MNRIITIFRRQSSIVVLVVLLSLGSCQNDKEQIPVISDVVSYSDNGQIIEDQYIVVLKEGTVDLGNLRTSNDYVSRTQHVKDVLSGMLQVNRVSTERVEQVYSNVLTGFSAKLSDEMLSNLKADSRVAFIEPDRIIALAPPNKNPDGVGSNAQQVPYGVTRVGGFVNYTGSGTAFIIDTGIDLTHPDLNVDPVRGFNAFKSGRDSKSLNDGNGHGTHVAGTVAAIDNGVGVVGVAAGATVVPVKVLDSRGSGSYSGVIAGVDYVRTVGKAGDVANMSLGGPVSEALDQAVKNASNNVKFIIAAGNSSDDANDYSPARVNGANIYTISAMDRNDNWASFSNFANPPVDYCAPGVSIYSTWKGGGYNTISGTSMASPHAAGVLLLGSARTSGYVNNDPDGSRDPIISR